MDSSKDNLYARWLEGQLQPEEEQNLKDAGDLEDLEAVVQAMDKLFLPKYDAEAGYTKFKKDNPPKETTKIRSLTIRRIWPLLAAAASVLLLLYAGNFFLTDSNSIETGNMTTLSYRFEDQSAVVLNDGSKLVFDEANWQQERVVDLRGEAIFTVQKGIPFIVNTPNGIVEVLGTSFNVRAWGGKLYVECYEGSVRVSSNHQETILTQAQSVNVKDGQMEETQTISHQKPLWTTGSSRFFGENLNQVFKELERQYNIKVNIPTVNRNFNGGFKHNDLETALKDICLPMGLTYDFSENKKEVIISGEK